MPNDAFKKNANTEVTTDIVMLRKRLSGERPKGPAWKSLGSITNTHGETIPLNEYFVAHPEMMLGEMRLEGGLYRRGEPSLISNGRDLAEQLAEAIALLPRNVFTPHRTAIRPSTLDQTVPAPENIKPNAYAVVNDRIGIREGATITILERLSPSRAQRIRGLIRVRDAVRRCLRTGSTRRRRVKADLGIFNSGCTTGRSASFASERTRLLKSDKPPAGCPIVSNMPSPSSKTDLLFSPHPGQSLVMTEGRPASAVMAQPAVFATTHWSVVLAAGGADTPQSSAALEKLCRAYWYPLYSHTRRRGYSEEEAQDLTQELFQRLLERQFLCGLLREGGRFRSFLLTALGHFLAEHWQRSKAQKRGGGQPIISIDAQTAEERYRLEPCDGRTPETIYEYRWAMTLLDQVLDRLQQEFSEAGKDELFHQLRTYLVEGPTAMSYAEGARRLGMSEAALRKAVERLRLRYQELFRQEIAHTVTSPAEVEDELRHLQTVMRG